MLRFIDRLVRGYVSDGRGREDMTHPEVVLEKNLIKGNQQHMAQYPREVGTHSAPGWGDKGESSCGPQKLWSVGGWGR